ncbi:uncharacterized protein GGS22DRAFT_174274 [Annulohypoxylon maeteangense]|uniref:uncharacterized protein n=1 Tax=Annulohypoxylon maeteangense TaxID=1927788 RepID=UPI0020087FC9|nr:uncharacterized protein GGS22DRAFT_174274 [Annulohypoxylon maeteangense]KAI0880813.1 hypothetical protein GGS22DRAFT_174274 [Annulohypoxylon maeteangense]
MTEVVPGDRTKLLQSKRAECSAIARSRKRKLCVLYAVATSTDGLPQRSFADPDAPPANPAESHFLEGSDILQGRKLNELNIPARPRIRSEYLQLPRLGEDLGSTENTHPPTINKKKDNTSISRPPVSLPPPSVPSRQGITDDKADTLSIVSQTTHPGSERISKSPQASWHPAQLANQATRTDTPAVLAMVNDQSQQSQSTTTANQTNLPAGDQPNGTSKYPVSLSSAPSSSSQTQASQPFTNEQQRQPSQVDETENAARKDLREGEPMELDVTPVKPAGVISGMQPIPLPDTSRTIDGVSSLSTNTVDTLATPNVITTKSSNGEVVPFAASSETNSMGMKDMASIRQSSQNGTLSGPVVAGTSESIPVDKVRMQSISQPTNNAVKAPINGSRETNAKVDTPTHPPKTSTSPVCVSTPENTVTADAQQRPSNIPTSLQQIPQIPLIPLIPQLPQLPLPANDNLRGPVMPHVRSDQQQVNSDFQRRIPNLNGDVVQSSTKSETVQKESSVASVASVASTDPSRAIPETPTEVKESRETQITQDIRRSPIQIRSDRRRTSSPTGVARQKPVSEILSEPPKLLGDAESSRTTSVVPSSRFSKKRSKSQKAKLKGKGNRSMVVFGKQSKGAMDSGKALVQSRSGAGQMASDDYFTPLFVQAFTSNSKWMRPLDQILHQAHKTLSTPDSYTHIFDNQACKVLKRVYHLQHHNKWSLRQPKRCPEPTRQPCHWDVLLKEMKWMRTDFREERKWKMAAAQNLAYACAEWVSSSIDDRKAMQVNAVIPPLVSVDPRDTTAPFNHVQDPENQPTPDLIPSAESDSPMEPDDEPHEGIIDTIAPSAIFALESDDVVFSLHQSASADRLLEQLPMYGSPLEVPKFDITAPEYDPDATWRRSALPLSRFVEGQMELTPTEPPKKRSRYHYAQEDDEDDEVVFDQFSGSQPRLEPLNADVALFRPENKSFRDRLHAGHQFRPPNEHTMPFQSFYESRSPSQWIQSEDDELKGLVREFSYNWSLISSILTSKSMFSSGAERRTPWECFERWVMLEGLPHDMQKTQYFKLWQGRIEASQQVIRQHQQQQQAQQAQQQQQAGPNGPVTPAPKRRYNVPLKVERRRNQKHLTMIDAMRKLAKKRETTLQKQQHNASLAAMRKTNETPQPRAPTKTPREYSIMRFERDQAMAERLAERMAQQQRHEAQRRAAIQRAQQGQVAQMAAAQNANQLSQNNPQMAASHPHAAMARVNAPSQISMNAQGRPRMSMHTPNGTGTTNHMSGGLVPPMQMNGASQVQMPSVNGQPRMAMPTTQPDLQLLMQAQQISEQQRRSVEIRRQQQQQQHQHQHQQQTQQQSHPTSQGGSMPLQSSPPAMRAAAMSGLNQKNYLNNAQAQAMMASFNSANGPGMSTPPAPGHPMTSQAGSPRPNTTIPQQTHQTYVSQLQTIETHIRQTHPNMTQDVVREMARQLLNTRHNGHNLAQSAMNAAAGGSGHAAAANGPHQYAQLLRAQQQQQAAAAAAAQAQQAQAQQGTQQHQRNSSGSATPTPSLPK